MQGTRCRRLCLCFCLVCKVDILIKPDNWSNETQQARQRADVFKFKTGESDNSGRQNFNDKITGLRAFIESNLEQTHQEDLTSEWLKTVIDKHWHQDKYKINLFGYINMFIERSKTKPNPKTGRPVSYKMQREYEATFKHLKNYATEKNKVIDFKDIDLSFYDGFIQYLQEAHPIKPTRSKETHLNKPGNKKTEGEKLAVNTIGKKIQTLKTFLNSATDEKLNTYDAYKSKKFVKLSEESESIYLNESELTKLFEKDFKDRPGLERVRDLFLVGCWTGCRFSDISQITPESISEGFIHLKQYKLLAKK